MGMARVGMVLAAVLMCLTVPSVRGGDVTYDGRSLFINGSRRILFSGSIHYPRSTPQMWPSLIAKAKQGGLDVIQTYVFWNIHEPHQGQYNFQGRYDLVSFIKAIQSQGLYVSLRIGPFIESEWKYGGFPFWLHDVPGIVYRSDNEPFKFYMGNFTTKIVEMMKAEKLYASQGGPIILSQIENEYQNVEAAFHERGPPYVRWAAAMAVGLHTGVPWVMCKQTDAPDPVINTCNGLNCGETFTGPNTPHKPSLWTENWTSQYQVFGGEPYIRSAEDIAYAVALFIAKNGTFVNYYMYHGGTNFDRSASSYVTTSYYDQAPLDEYGMLRQPKWGHLRELHAVIKQFSETLLQGTRTSISLGQLQEVHVFRETSGKCVAFLSNNDPVHSANVEFQNQTYNLPRRSIIILADGKNVAYNTAKVNAQYGFRSTSTAEKFNHSENWEELMDEVPNTEKVTFTANGLLEHMNLTKDETDYLWYSVSYEHASRVGHQPVLRVNSLAHVVHAFVNDVYIGSAHGSHDNQGAELKVPIPLRDGENNISLLSAMVGSPDSGAYLEKRVVGLRRVRVYVRENAYRDFNNGQWGYQIGLVGEKLRFYTKEGSNSVKWSTLSSSPQSLMWYKTTFNTPLGDDPVALNLESMGKGEAWINGENIGRYWVSFKTPKGLPSQSLYHVPRSFLKPSGNLLVLFEEMGGNPLGVTVETVSITKVCGVMSDLLPESMFSSRRRLPRLKLHCPRWRSISAIQFASYGTPVGGCGSGNYTTGFCHSRETRAIVEQACLGKRSCSVTVAAGKFGEDPCPGISKSLLVVASCH